MAKKKIAQAVNKAKRKPKNRQCEKSSSNSHKYRTQKKLSSERIVKRGRKVSRSVPRKIRRYSKSKGRKRKQDRVVKNYYISSSEYTDSSDDEDAYDRPQKIRVRKAHRGYKKRKRTSSYSSDSSGYSRSTYSNTHHNNSRYHISTDSIRLDSRLRHINDCVINSVTTENLQSGSCVCQVGNNPITSQVFKAVGGETLVREFPDKPPTEITFQPALVIHVTSMSSGTATPFSCQHIKEKALEETLALMRDPNKENRETQIEPDSVLSRNNSHVHVKVKSSHKFTNLDSQRMQLDHSVDRNAPVSTRSNAGLREILSPQRFKSSVLFLNPDAFTRKGKPRIVGERPSWLSNRYPSQTSTNISSSRLPSVIHIDNPLESSSSRK